MVTFSIVSATIFTLLAFGALYGSYGAYKRNRPGDSLGCAIASVMFFILAALALSLNLQ